MFQDVQRIYELDEQKVDPNSVSHVISWLVPLPTFLPVEEFTTITFGDPASGQERIVLRLFSAETLALEEERIWELADIANELFRGSHTEQIWEGASQSFRETSKVRQTFVEVSTFVDLRNLEDEDIQEIMHSQFEEGLDLIRQLQNAVFSIDKVARPLVSPQTLPFIVPYSVHSCIGHSTDSKGMSIYLIPGKLIGLRHWYHEDADERAISSEDTLNALVRQVANGPFSRYSELLNDAQVATGQIGLYRTGVLSCATAGEVLLDELLRCLLWENGHTPEQAGELFAKKYEFRSRTVSQLQQLIGNDWNLRGKGPAAKWFESVYALRHRIVHAGENPNAAEANAAIACTTELSRFVAECLAKKHHSFPRTTMFYLGIPGLERQNLWNQKLQELVYSQSEPQWIPTFASWRRSVEIIRDQLTQKRTLEGDLDLAEVLVWVHPGGKSKWVLFDQKNYLAAEVEPADLKGGNRAELIEVEAFISKARQGTLEQPFMRVLRAVTVRESVSIDWVLPYHLLPMMNVMVDGSDQAYL